MDLIKLAFLVEAIDHHLSSGCPPEEALGRAVKNYAGAFHGYIGPDSKACKGALDLICESINSGGDR